MGFKKPSSIQEKALPLILGGTYVLVVESVLLFAVFDTVSDTSARMYSIS
jgi:hypothetical protein